MSYLPCPPIFRRTEVAAQITGRSSKQCRERWTTNVDPSIKKTPFTPEEDRVIMEQWKMHGAKWSIICEMLPGRAQTKVRDRFKQLMRKQSSKTGSQSQDTAQPQKASPGNKTQEVKPSKRCTETGSTSAALDPLHSVRSPKVDSDSNVPEQPPQFRCTTQATTSVLSFASRLSTQPGSSKIVHRPNMRDGPLGKRGRSANGAGTKRTERNTKRR